MGKEATAKITFTLENAEEVLSLLRQLKSFVDGGATAGGGSLSGTPAAPGTAPGSGTAAPPVGAAPSNPATANPGAVPGAMPQNTPFVGTTGNAGGMFGTWNGNGFSSLVFDPIAQRYFDPSNGSYFLAGGQPGFGGGVGKPPVQPPGAGAQFMGAMAAFGVGQQIASIGGQMASTAATAQVNGQAFYAERMLPGVTTLSMIGAGALAGGIATSWSGPGSLVGAGIGAVIGGVSGDAMRPFIERNVNFAELNRLQAIMGTGVTPDAPRHSFWTNPITAIAEQFGYRGKAFFGDDPTGRDATPNDMIEARVRGLTSGKTLGESTYRRIEEMLPDSPVARSTLTRALERARYARSNVAKRGSVFGDEDSDLSDIRDILIGDSYGNEYETAAALRQAGLVNQADKTQLAGDSRLRLESNMIRSRARYGFSRFQFDRALRYGGSSRGSSAGQDFLASSSTVVSQMRQQAAMLRASGKTAEAEALMLEASQMEISDQDSFYDAVYSTKMDEAGARAGLATGRADRSFETALYGGRSAADLPFEQKASAYRQQASELEKLMAERGDRLSPAERARMTEQIEALKFRADFGLAREKESMVNNERLASTGLSNAQEMGREMPGILRGSAVDQTRQFELQADALSRVRTTYEDILRTSRYLTAEQRIQYQTQIENLKVDEERARVSGIYAKNSAVRQTIETGNVEAGVGSTISLIRGAGGAAGSAAQIELLGLTDANLSASEAELSANIQSGMDPDSPQNQAIRTRIASMKIGRENQQRSLAISPMSAEDRGRRSTLATESAFYERGYGTFGDIRGNLLAQISMVEKRMDELSANRDRIRSGKVAGVSWTDAMEADFTEARNAAAIEALNLSERYNYGYDQRLISEAYNMSGMGRLGMTRFTRREAAASGVFHRALGGSEEQTRSMREMYPSMTRAMGSGNPMNFADRAIGGESRASVEVLIRVQDSTGRIRDNDVQVTNQKTSQDMNVNVQAQKRPSG